MSICEWVYNPNAGPNGIYFPSGWQQQDCSAGPYGLGGYIYPTPGTYEHIDLRDPFHESEWIKDLIKNENETTEKKEEEKKMNKEEKRVTVSVTQVNAYNNKVVIVRFSDGTFTKSVCSDNDNFDLDIGISLCILKKYINDFTYGHMNYPKLMRNIHKMMDLQAEDRKKQLEEKQERRKAQANREAKNKAKRVRKAEEAYGDLIRNAVKDALKDSVVLPTTDDCERCDIQ